MLKQSDEAGCDIWASEIKLLLYSFGFGYVWHQQGVGNIDLFVCIFKLKLVDTAGQNPHIDVTNNCKLKLYRIYKSSLEIEPYLLVAMHWKHRAALGRFRCVSHKLAIERGRALRYDRSVRVCKYCEIMGHYCIEDEYHILLICPLYFDIRNKYIATHFTRFIPSDVVFIQIMSNTDHICIKGLAVFIYNMFKIHAHYYLPV